MKSGYASLILCMMKFGIPYDVHYLSSICCFREAKALNRRQRIHTYVAFKLVENEDVPTRYVFARKNTNNY